MVWHQVFDRYDRKRTGLNDRKKLCQFGNNVRKYRRVNTVTVSFNTMGQKTEMSQWKKNEVWHET